MTREEIRRVIEAFLQELTLISKEENPAQSKKMLLGGKEATLDIILPRIQEKLSIELPSNLDEAAVDFADNARKQLFFKDYAISSIADYDHGCIDGFKAGAKWMAGQDKKEIEHAFFLGYNECEDRMKKEFEKRAMTGTINNTGYPTTIQLNTFDSSLKNGEEVIVQVIKK